MNENFLKEFISSTIDKYSSVDDIPNNMLKQTISVLFKYILEIINASFSSGVFPQFLKLSHITPIINDKRDVNSLSNYRLISNLSFMSKLIDKCVFLQLQEHLYVNYLLFEYQSAYKHFHSCETALLKIYNDILFMLKPNSYVGMLFLDFSSAFDIVDHQILLKKLNITMVLKGQFYNGSKFYLSDRQFQVKVKVGNSLSSPI